MARVRILITAWMATAFLVLSGPAAAEEELEEIRAALEQALYAGDAAQILAAFTDERIEALRDQTPWIMQIAAHAVDMSPRFDISKRNARDWDQVVSRLKALAAAGFKAHEFDPLILWAREEVSVLRELVRYRTNPSDSPNRALSESARRMSMSEGEADWATRAYIRALDLHLLGLGMPGGNQFMALSGFAYLKAKMDQRARLFPKYAIPLCDAYRSYGEALLALRAKEINWEAAGKAVREGTKKIADYVWTDDPPLAAVRLHNDFADLVSAHEELTLRVKHKPIDMEGLQQGLFHDSDAHHRVLDLSLPYSHGWHAFFGTHSGQPALHISKVSLDGTIERDWKITLFDLEAKHALPGAKKPVLGSNAKGLAAAIMAQELKVFEEEPRTRSPRKSKLHSKWEGGWYYEIKGDDIRGKRRRVYGYIAKRRTCTLALECTEHGKLPKKLPLDVTRFLTSLVPRQ